MFSLEEMRKIDSRMDSLSDEQVLKIRDLLYSMGELALECYFEEKAKKLDNK